MQRLELLIPPPIVALLCVGMMWCIHRYLPVIPLTVWLPFSLVLGIVGGICGAWALWLFVRQHTTINPHTPHKSSQLVTGGIYRITRNPMYLGVLCFLLALTTVWQNLATLAGPLLFMLYLNRFQIQPEERILRERFGQAYMDYCERVRRWL